MSLFRKKEERANFQSLIGPIPRGPSNQIVKTSKLFPHPISENNVLESYDRYDNPVPFGISVTTNTASYSILNHVVLLVLT